MQQDKILTIVIPSYNMEHYLRRCLDSLVAARNIERAEVLIINDGSTDGTSAIAHEYERRCPAVRVVDKANGHYGSCLNRGLAEARGKYFRILDADDRMNTDALEAFIDRLGQTDADLVLTFRTEVKVMRDGTTRTVKLPFDEYPFGATIPADRLEIQNTDAHDFGEYTNMHSMTYKTDVIRQTGLVFPEHICYTDFLYDVVPLGAIKTFTVFDLFLYVYYSSQPGSSTAAKSQRNNYKDIVTVMPRLCDYFETHRDVLPNIRKCQSWFLYEAGGFLMSIVRLQRHFLTRNWAEAAAIINRCVALGVRPKLTGKYYFRPLLKGATPARLRRSLALYHLLHPFK